jgi:hypothetical protein
MIRDLFTIRRDEFKEYPAIQSCLDLVDENGQHIPGHRGGDRILSDLNISIGSDTVFVGFLSIGTR